jgi:hypothetical protein
MIELYYDPIISINIYLYMDTFLITVPQRYWGSHLAQILTKLKNLQYK